jgi:hypothetical protein
MSEAFPPRGWSNHVCFPLDGSGPRRLVIMVSTLG